MTHISYYCIEAFKSSHISGRT